MDFSFNASEFRAEFHALADQYVEAASSAEDENSPHNMAIAMDQAIDVMQRADADAEAAGSPGMTVSQDDITRIGEYALSILEALAEYIQQTGGQQEMGLARLTIPVALWTAKHGGRIDRLEMLVNALAASANELRDPGELAELSRVLAIIVGSVSDSVRQDLEPTNPMRPWRVLNLNYGIVATRSHDPALIEQAYDTLVKNLPQDARQFFREGMQQMDIVGYPEEVREVVEKYDRMWGADSTLH